MKNSTLVCLTILLLFLVSCDTTSSETGSKNSPNNTAKKEPTAPISGVCTNGVKYELFTDGKGKKPKFKDYLSLYLSYSTVGANDSIFLSTYDRAEPVQMRFTQSLFGGIINEGLLLMTEGDSVVFLVPANLHFKNKRLPSFVKRGENIMYNLKLVEVIDNPMLSK